MNTRRDRSTAQHGSAKAPGERRPLACCLERSQGKEVALRRCRRPTFRSALANRLPDGDSLSGFFHWLEERGHLLAQFVLNAADRAARVEDAKVELVAHRPVFL